MTRSSVRTVTLNPSIDVSSDVERIEPTVKLRTTTERMDPGGGGINVARVLHRFGTRVEALFLAGGATGTVLGALLERQGLRACALPIADDTRTSLTVHETSTGREFRFVPEGPQVSNAELEAALDAVSTGSCDFIVASGSLPPGAPDDLYARMASRISRGTKFVLDTSGAELKAALAVGGLFLVKPSKGELEQFVGRKLGGRQEIAASAGAIVDQGGAERIVVTCGRDGAIMVDADGAWFLPAVPVQTRSTVGAGDSFLAGMIHGFVTGQSPGDSFRLGAACGASSALSPGTGLARPDDALALLKKIGVPQPI
jgi:6-phosphofructokinase 2